jgi:tetratricopeptide (TPR) repeat protein
MKKDLNYLKKLQEQTAICEISTAADAVDVDQQLRLIELYRELNLDQVVQSELNRLRQKSPQHQTVLATMLDVFTKQKMISMLTPMVDLAQRVANPSPVLRLALAQALIAMRRFDAAAVQYTELAEAYDRIPQLAQHLAEFVCLHPPTPALITTLNTFFHTTQYDYLPAILHYVFCRILETQEDPNIDPYLNHIRIREIRQSDIALDLARLCFRYCKWDRAAIAAKRVLMTSPKNESAKSMLVSAYSFAGRLNKAANYIRILTKSNPPLVIDSDQLSSIYELIEKQNKCLPQTDVSNSPEANDTAVIESEELHSKCPEITKLCEEQNQKITASMIETGRMNAKPWDILVMNDWNRPHIMVQKLDHDYILHGFLPSDGPDCWRWQEVPIFIKGRESDKYNLLYIPAEADSCDQPATLVNNLFCQIEKELDSDYIRKELNNV